MQAQDAKYKKWGWGALIGLAAVIVIAGLAVAISMSAPKKTTEADKASTGPSSVASNTDNSSNKSDNKDEGREDNDKGDTDGTDGTDGIDGTNNSGNSNNSNNSSNSSNAGNTNSGNANTASNMPKTGPEEDIASIIAWAAIAGLGAYYFLNAKKSA